MKPSAQLVVDDPSANAYVEEPFASSGGERLSIIAWSKLMAKPAGGF